MKHHLLTAVVLAALLVMYGVVGRLDNEAQTKATKAEKCANSLRHPHRKGMVCTVRT